jgi:POT family proton-dependent oligopeptide transporter
MEQVIDVSKANRFPGFLKVLFFVEMWERFSYYGMRSLLVIFLTSHLGFEDKKAYAIYSLFAAIGYAGPVLGGFLADKLMGFRHLVLIGGIIMTLGHASLALVDFKTDMIYIGLALIAIGTGCFKGNITNLLGACYEEQATERSRGFTIFYVSVNLGGFLASVSCGYVAHLYGWEYGFSLAGIGMAIGLVTFIRCQNVLGIHGLPPKPELMRKKIFGLNIFSIIIICALCVAFLVSKILVFSESFANVLACFGILALGIFIYTITKSSAVQRKQLVALSILIAFLMFFFALEMQLGSLIALFTKRNVVDEIFGIAVPASVSQALNPLSIMIFGSLIGRYMKFNKKYTTFMFALGILTMAICFFVLYVGCLDAVDGRVEYMYLVAAVFCMGLGELCIAPVVQEQATLLAPQHLKGFIMGIVMLSLAFSNLAGIVISKFVSVASINGEVDILESLAIYRDGFMNIGLVNLGLVVLFLCLSNFVHKVITQNHEES